MEIIDFLFGSGDQLTLWQMSMRAFVTFFICLALIRCGGARIVGNRSAFDTIIVITVGSVLARGIVGASPYFSTVAASLVMIAVGRCIAWLASRSKKISYLVTGKPLKIYENDHLIKKNMRRGVLSETDFLESLRLQTQSGDPRRIHEAYIETNGRISFVLK